MASPIIYLDANSTTPPDPAVWDRVREVSLSCYGNPGSTHQIGRLARKSLKESRATIARVLGADHRELVLTSGGTESTNLALHGLAAAVAPEKRTIALTGGEHPATRETAERLVQLGWKAVLIPLNSKGMIAAEGLQSLPWDRIGLVSVIYAHNEIGVLQDVSTLREICESRQIPWHLDIVQAVGRVPFSFQETGASAASFGVHKCHGPRGIGGLLLKEDVPFVPLTVGGFQEASRRPGTESVGLAAGMAWLLQDYEKQHEEIHASLLSLRERFEQGLKSRLKGITVHGADAPRLPNTSNVAFAGLDAEALLVALDLAGVCCSLGSACASGSAEPSPVLLAMGIDREQAKSALRFSVHRFLTLDEIDDAVNRIVDVVSRLRSL